MIHVSAEVAGAAIGAGTSVWQHVVVSPGAVIGENCNVCSHCFIETGVTVGNRVTIKNGVSLWTGICIEDDAFVGPGVQFCNDKFPRSKVRPVAYAKTVIGRGASIGSGAVILPGIIVGANAMVGAGAVVSRSVPANAVVVGNPARVVGFVDVGQQTREVFRAGLAATKVVDAESDRRADTGPSVGRLIPLDCHGDSRGHLAVANVERKVPFVVKRFFCITSVPAHIDRGNHAHRKCHQFLYCAHGSVDVALDNGFTRDVVRLESPTVGLHIPPMVWGVQFNYSPDASLIVFASDEYDRADYIDSYAEFLSLVNQK